MSKSKTMSLCGFAASRLPALAVVALLLTGKPATAQESQPGPRAPGQAVHFAVTVPADAEVWFDGAKTAQAGPDREFVSPPLRPGQAYSYDVRVRWKEGGRGVDRTRHVTFYAGDQVNLDFTADRHQAQYSYYGQRSLDYTPSFTMVPLSNRSPYAPRRSVRPLGDQDPLNGSGPPGFHGAYQP